LYGIPDKYIKVISAMCEDNAIMVNVGSEVISWFVLNQEFSRVVFYPSLYGAF